MFKITRIISFLVIMMILNVNFLFSQSAFASDNASVTMRNVKATNPNCQLAKAIATAVGVGLAAGIISFLLAYPANMIPIVGTAIATGLVIAGIASLVAVVIGTPMYFACNWSFVRHPVMRFEENDGSNGTPGNYKECERPSQPYPSCANKEYRSQDEYFQCLAGAWGVSVDEAKKKEGTCPDKKYKPAGGYYWPKNRVSNSNYIEFCYRLPLGVGLIPTVLLAYITDTEIRGLDKSFIGEHGGLRMREADYGNNDIKRGKAYIRGPVECKTLKPRQKEQLHAMVFKAIERDDNICVDAWGLAGGTAWFPQPEVGCHMRPSGPPAPMCEKSIPIEEGGKIVKYDNSKCFSCYISSACYGKGAETKSPLPVTTVIVECIKESLSNLLTGKCAGNPNQEGFLVVAQKRLKNAVNAALVLALILFAIKAALGGIQSASELYILGIKFALVVYFTNGEAMSHYYDELVKLSIGLSDIVMQAGGNETICNYTEQDYAKGLGYLAPWDRLDCRIMFYFGSQLNGGTAVTVLTVLLSAAFLPVSILFGFQILICLAAIFAVLMIIFITIWMVYLFILSLIALTIMALISPLIIPMVLFQATKPFFDGWVRELVTYSLYPVMLFAFLSLIFTVFDQMYFEGLKFKRHPIKVMDADRITFVLENKDACSIGDNDLILACIMSNMKFGEANVLFGVKMTTFEFDGAGTGEIWTKLGVMGLVGFLFYHLLNSISGLAAELAGNPRGNLDKGELNPKAMMKKAIGAAASVRGAVREGAGKAGDAIKERLKPNKEGDKVEGASPKGGSEK